MVRVARVRETAVIGKVIRAAALGAAVCGCSVERRIESHDVHGDGGARLDVAAATTSEVSEALESRGRIRRAFLLEHPSVSRSPTGGYKVRVASAVRGASLVLSGVPLDELDAIWNGHDPQTQSVWVMAEGHVEPRVTRQPGTSFDDFSPELYQPLPSRDPWGRLVDARLLAWEYGPKFVFQEPEPRTGK